VPYDTFTAFDLQHSKPGGGGVGHNRGSSLLIPERGENISWLVHRSTGLSGGDAEL
jgi:hypothetical protein